MDDDDLCPLLLSELQLALDTFSCMNVSVDGILQRRNTGLCVGRNELGILSQGGVRV